MTKQTLLIAFQFLAILLFVAPALAGQSTAQSLTAIALQIPAFAL